MKQIILKTRSALTNGVVAGCLVLGLATSSLAQYAHFFRDAAMTPEDIEMAKNAAATLYTKSGVAVGETEKWSNAKSGAEGVVEILEVEDQGPCVTFRHLAKTKSEPQIRYYSRRCKDAGGNWVLSAN
ncbi:hypothetical protein [uncultured Roseovarius sp.]|uniref:hypothetical protein n=1 Tax=uncultured Roseovarius sp. TaxID=293344 RepID=UPI002601BC08|nr:hypothetical protein [uncultured Roseovarius sp.]